MQIDIRDVARQFGSVHALSGVTCAIESGGRVALIGPNGSGKSTLTRAIVGTLAVRGELRVGGLDPFRSHAEVARKMAYVPQVAPRLAATVGEIVGAVAALRGIASSAIAEVAHALALDVNAVADRPLRGLSGGMRQKLLLALALAQPVDLVVLDEPTASLDTDSRQRFFAWLADLPARWQRSPTVVLCSHRLEEIRQVVDRVVALQDGRVVFDGSADTLLRGTSRGVIEARVHGDSAGAWLATQGFRRVPSGWWCREVQNGARAKTLMAMARELGADLEDVVVREPDLVVQPPPPSRMTTAQHEAETCAD